MNYRDPKDVTSPKDAITDLVVLHNGGDKSVSIAKMLWEGVPSIGMRWNVAMREWDEQDKINLTKECLGMPVSRGYPTWFILPSKEKMTEELKNVLKEILF